MRNIIGLKRMRWQNIRVTTTTNNKSNRRRNRKSNRLNIISTTAFILLSLTLSFLSCSVGGVEAFASSSSRRTSRYRSVAFCDTSTKMSSSDSNKKQKTTGMEEMAKVAKDMNDRAKGPLPFTEEELDMIISSMQNIAPPPNDDTRKLDWTNIRQLLSDVAYLSHKDWDRTGESATRFRNLLLNTDDEGALLSMSDFQTMFQRIMTEGNWYGAAKHVSSSDTTTSKPWVVLVTGVNGIRKTTSVYQSWFPQLLEEALVSPPEDNNDETTKSTLPTGENSFFRQLDHMIISLTNEDFKRLYQLTSQLLQPSDEEDGKDNITQSVVDAYSDMKAAIFSRFRTLSEILGVLLVREAQKEKLNVMIETSGRDIAMFHYVDKYFPSDRYNKLALHFFVDDLSHAEGSVDQRMVREIQDGIQAKTVQQIIHANAGGPYGSSVLQGVQADSDRVWDQVVMKGGVEPNWYKASIRIDGHATKPWTACAIKPDGSHGTTHTFIPPKHLQQK